MRIFGWPIAALLSAGMTLTGVSTADAPSCGAPGLPACPLQHWMRVHAAAPLALGKLDQVTRAFERIDAMNPNPDKWQNWSKIARDGAAAAREGKSKRARSACGRCHRAYRRAYNMHHRTRSIDDK